MKRMVFAALALLIIGACLPSNLIPISLGQPTAAPVEATQSSLQTIPTATVTSTVPPTFTPVSVSETSIPPTTSPVPSETATTVASPVPNLTTTPATATAFTVSPESLTPTLVGNSTATPGVLTYGTLPPEVPFSQLRLVNRSKRQAYISLQVTTVGGPAILEYPVYGLIKVKAPIGYYLYVAWVGGNKMVGNFRLHANEDLTIILYKDRVDIK